MEEKRIAKEKAEKAANELQKMTSAATVIQVRVADCDLLSIKGSFPSTQQEHI